MQTNQEATDLIKFWEGFRSAKYHCSAGVVTWGYGSTRDINGRRLVMDGDTITRDEAEVLLRKELRAFERRLTGMLKVELNPNQFGACVSFCYNLGSNAFKSSTLRRRINRSNFEGAKGEFKRWVYCRGVRLNGLISRRRDEATLFASAASNTPTD